MNQVAHDIQEAENYEVSEKPNISLHLPKYNLDVGLLDQIKTMEGQVYAQSKAIAKLREERETFEILANEAIRSKVVWKYSYIGVVTAYIGFNLYAYWPQVVILLEKFMDLIAIG